MDSSVINSAIQYIKALFQNNSDGHDAQHTLRVYHNALLISESEPNCNLFVVSLAALLHDVDDYKLFRIEKNANARTFLSSQHIEPEQIDYICDIINSVSFSKNHGKRLASIDAKIVQDADRLDAIGAIGIARTFAYGGKCGRTLEASVQHFHDKLLLLKSEMNTKQAKEIAELRHSFMNQFLNEWYTETSL
ncbi:MAG: HD domain-containing protein [Treponema sp.]|nr:HD domain-containing protein [Treponema sp.]